MDDVLLNAVRVVAFVSTISFAWPQVWRVRFGRPLTGLSGTSVLITICAMASWLSYGVFREDVLIVGVNVPLIAAFSYLMLRVLRASMLDHRVALGLSALTVAGVLGGAIIDPAVTGAFAVGFGCVGNLPQLRTALRERDLSGLSWEAYALSVIASASWFVYGVLQGDVIIFAQHLVVLPVTATIAVRTILSHRRLRTVGPPVEPEPGGAVQEELGASVVHHAGDAFDKVASELGELPKHLR